VIKPTNFWLGVVLMVICHLLRSTDVFFRVGVVKEVPVTILIMWEHLFNTAALAPLLLKNWRVYTRISARDLLLFLLVGWGASALGILCFTQAFHYINPALVILLQKLQPLVTISLGVALLGERFKPVFFVWAGTAVVSSYFVSFSLTNPFSGEWSKVGIGTCFALGAVFFWGSGTVWGKFLLRSYDQIFILANRFLLGSFFTVLLAWSVNSDFWAGAILAPNGPLFWKILYMALVPGLLATGLFYFGLSNVEASIASILELIFPLSSVLIMWKFFGQSLDRVQIGAAFILFYSMSRITSPSMKQNSR